MVEWGGGVSHGYCSNDTSTMPSLISIHNQTFLLFKNLKFKQYSVSKKKNPKLMLASQKCSLALELYYTVTNCPEIKITIITILHVHNGIEK
jgi:hypothetical protein